MTLSTSSRMGGDERKFRVSEYMDPPASRAAERNSEYAPRSAFLHP